MQAFIDGIIEAAAKGLELSDSWCDEGPTLRRFGYDRSSEAGYAVHGIIDWLRKNYEAVEVCYESEGSSREKHRHWWQPTAFAPETTTILVPKPKPAPTTEERLAAALAAMREHGGALAEEADRIEKEAGR